MRLPCKYKNEFCRLKNTEVRGENIALLDINSAWRCTKSELDRGNLLIHIDSVKKAISKAKEFSPKLILCNMHHSLSDFKEFIASELEDIIYENCNFLLTGHVHKAKTTIIEGSSIGLLHNRASAVYNYQDKLSQFGYCVIYYDSDDYEATVKKYLYADNHFKKISDKHYFIPLEAKKKEINEFRKTIRRIEKGALSKADDIFVSGRNSYDDNGGFQSLFVDPVLRDKSFKEIITRGKKIDSGVINYSDIINITEDCVIYGIDKCGKTSILWKLLLDTLKNFYQLKTIPFYIDVKRWSSSSPKPLIKQLSEYLSMNRKKVGEIFLDYKLLLLIDNYRNNDGVFKSWLKDELKNFNDYRVVATINETLEVV